jgi:hypothetical protein
MQDTSAAEALPGARWAGTSLKVGLLAFVTSPFPVVPIVLGVMAVLAGIRTHRLDDRLDINVQPAIKRRATAGIVFGCTAFLLGSVSTFLTVILLVLSFMSGGRG